MIRVTLRCSLVVVVFAASACQLITNFDHESPPNSSGGDAGESAHGEVGGTGGVTGKTTSGRGGKSATNSIQGGSSVTQEGGTSGATNPIGGATSAESGPCKSGAQTCVDNVPQLCLDDGVWQPQEACKGSTPKCRAGSCVCGAGTVQCKEDGVTPQFCTEIGEWQDRTSCTGTSPYCNGSGICGECKAKSRKCDKATPYICSDAGKWEAQSVCTGSAPFCTNGTCSSSCPGIGGPTMKLLPEGYCIDTTEVTREHYYTWLISGPVANAASQIPECAWNGSFVPGTDASNDWPPTSNLQTPVAFVDWCDAYAYCLGVGKRLCGKIGGGAFLSNDDIANPTLSQWTNACSAHGANDFAFGDTYVPGACNGGDGGSSSADNVASRSTCQSPTVGYQGVYDLSGNVLEFEDNCSPGVGMSAMCITRGGSYGYWDDLMMCTSTMTSTRSSTSVGLGFRCCS